MKKFLIALSLMLAACNPSPRGHSFVEHDVLANVSFEPEHQECSKGCTTVPDTWFLQFCKIDTNDCLVKKISHAPWDWEVKGTKVDITWQNWTLGYASTIENMILVETKEMVQL